jgi:hypothetical protein
LAKRLSAAAVAVLVTAAGVPASAQEEQSCQLAPRLDKDRFLRRLTLDLLGRPPLAEEYAAIADRSDVPPELIDGMLASDEFVWMMQRLHYDLLWPAIPVFFLSYFNLLLPLEESTPLDPVYWRGIRAQYVLDLALPAGVDMAYRCVDEPAPDPAFSVVTGDPVPLRSETIEGYERPIYGWVRVAPYWASDRQIKVCAIEARESLYSREGYPCEYVPGYFSTCGCGTDLRWCGTYETEYYLLQAGVRAELDWAVARVVREDRPYTDLLTSQETTLTGPVAYFMRNQRYLADQIRMDVPSVPDPILDQIPFSETGRVVERQGPHAGILTSPIFLLRHQTVRARVNRFDNAFLCQPYSPPPGGIGDLSSVAPNPNLAEREKCSYCHQRLEERAVYFGALAEVGGSFLPSAEYPVFRQDCADCALGAFQSGDPMACSEDCARHYFVGTEGTREVLEPWWGIKKELAFRPAAETENYFSGPRALVTQAQENGSLGRCLAQRLVGTYLHREVLAEEAEWLDELAERFQSGGYRLRDLARAVVTSETYRRAP